MTKMNLNETETELLREDEVDLETGRIEGSSITKSFIPFI